MSKTPNGIPHPEEEEVWEVQTFELTYAHGFPFTLPPGFVPFSTFVIGESFLAVGGKIDVPKPYLVAVRQKDGPAKAAGINYFPFPTKGDDVVGAVPN